jgi:hypothetical protein
MNWALNNKNSIDSTEYSSLLLQSALSAAKQLPAAGMGLQLQRAVTKQQLAPECY